LFAHHKGGGKWVAYRAGVVQGFQHTLHLWGKVVGRWYRGVAKLVADGIGVATGVPWGKVAGRRGRGQSGLFGRAYRSRDTGLGVAQAQLQIVFTIVLDKVIRG
jgi:hypothetical protein